MDAKQPYVIIPGQSCKKDRIEDLTSKLYLQQNGSLVVIEEDGYQEVLPLREYCFEYIHDVEADEYKFEAFSCFPSDEKESYLYTAIDNCNTISESDYAHCLIPNVTRVLFNRSIRTRTGVLYDKFQYIQMISDESGQLEYYNKQCLCKNKLCVRKCCSNDEVHVRENRKLQCNKSENANNTKLNLDFYNFTKDANSIVNDSMIQLIDGIPCARGKYRLSKEDGELFFLQYNTGFLYTIDESEEELFQTTQIETFYTWNEYCIENKLTGDGDLETDYFVCFPVEVEPEPMVEPYAFGMIISIPFLFITFAVYAIIPELQNLHGKSLMCYVFTLMFAYTLLAFIQLSPTQPDPWCEIIAFSIYYLFLVSFFWLNVMCFDIWWTFSGIGGFRSSHRSSEQKKFFFYHLYAWGVPSTIIVFSMIMQYQPSVPDTWYKPRLGDTTCWFGDKEGRLLYFHLPLFFVITCNVILFVSTAIKIIKIKRDTAMLKTKDSQRHESSNYTKDKQRFALYLKLFIVMGVNWTMELMSIVFEPKESKDTSYVWLLTDLGNTLHGVLIFIIFVCKRQIWALLVKRYHVMMGRPYQANAAFSRTQTTSYSVSQSTDTNVSQHGSVKLNNFN